MKKPRAPVGLILILVAFAALGAMYLRATPLLETPDEPSHFSVVKYIADEARLPTAQAAPADAGPVPVITEGPPVYYAPPLYYVLGALLVADLNTDGFAQGVIPNPNWARGWAPTPGRSPDNKHIYVLTADQRPPLTGWATAMVRLRFFSLLLGGVTVCGTYALARTLWPAALDLQGGLRDHGWALAATALVAFNPAFLFVTMGITNDALLFALSTWAFALMARLVRAPKPDSGVRAALLGVVLGLAALTKQSALAFLPVAALAVVWGAHPSSSDGLSPSGSRSWRTALKWLVMMVVPILFLGGWWYVHNALAYGDPLGFQPHQTPGGEWRPTLSLLLRQLSDVLRGYWAVFGWGLILVEPVIYATIALFVLAGLLGLAASFFSDSLQQSRAERHVVAILVLGVLLNLIGLILWLWRTSAPYGRLLFPTVGPLVVLVVLGWRHWLGHKTGRLFAWAVALTLGMYAVIVPGRYLRPVFADPLVRPSVVAEGTPLDVVFDVHESNETGLRLLAYQMTPAKAGPGDRVTLTLYWQAEAPLPAPLTVFVQVAARDPAQRVAGLDDYLGGSHYPSQVWQPGETIRQVHQMRLSDDAPAPGLYWFTVGLYGGPDGKRLPVIADGALAPGGALRLGPLRVLSGDDPRPRQQIDYRLGSAIRLAGYDVVLPAPDSSESSPPDSLVVTLYWQAVTTPEQDLIAFVHLVDMDGRLVAQHDGAPRQGDYPTQVWQAGDRVPDPHTLVLPPGQKPGAYRLLVGLYHPRDGARVAVVDQANQRVPDDIVILTDVYLSDESERDGD